MPRCRPGTRVQGKKFSDNNSAGKLISGAVSTISSFVCREREVRRIQIARRGESEDMKGNTGRLKRSSIRRSRLAIVFLGLASPFALYCFVNGGLSRSGGRLGDAGLDSWERGRGFGASHGKGHAAGGHATYQGEKHYDGFENGIAGTIDHDPSVWDAASNPKDHRLKYERESPAAPDYGLPHTIGTKHADAWPGHVADASGSDGDDRRHVGAGETLGRDDARRAEADSVVFDDDLLDAGAESELSDEECASLADEWVESRRKLYTDHTRARRGGGHVGRTDDDAASTALDSSPEKSDLLFFLHIPRTAGRTFHFCYLKLAYPENERCGKSYDELRVDVHDPNCKFLASHDDYSLVERFREQPRVVTMFRDPVARFLSSYEFAVEVSVRSFGMESKAPSSRVSTREIWPWNNAVRFIDRDLRRYKARVERQPNREKESIENVYNNTVYTPLHEFVDTPEAYEDFHNAQFLQLLGLSTNSNPSTEPSARDLRSCLRPGAAATETLYAYAEERLREEIDVTVTHERLDDALRMTSAELGLSMLGPSFPGANHAPQHSKLLLAKLERAARRREGRVDGSVRDEGANRDASVGGETAAEDGAARSDRSEIVGFTFRFGKVTFEQLKDKTWRAGYLEAIVSVLAYTCGVEARNVHVIPPGVTSSWDKDEGAWQTALVEFPPARVARDDGASPARPIEDLPPFDPRAARAGTQSESNARKLGPDELLALLRDSRDSSEDVAAHLVLAAEGFDAYGEMTVHAVGRVVLPGGDESSQKKRAPATTEVYKLGGDPTFVPLGEAFRACERVQTTKYARLRSKAFATLRKHVSGDFEPFVKDNRAKIAPSLLDHIRELNFLDNRLHRFAARLFDERLKANEEKIGREVIPPRLSK